MAAKVQFGFVDEAADAGGVNVKALLGTAGVEGTLAARVTAADADGSGVLSLAELVSVFRSEEDAQKEKRMMRRCIGLKDVRVVAQAAVGILPLPPRAANPNPNPGSASCAT